jgi:hypothetical protein
MLWEISWAEVESRWVDECVSCRNEKVAAEPKIFAKLLKGALLVPVSEAFSLLVSTIGLGSRFDVAGPPLEA